MPYADVTYVYLTYYSTEFNKPRHWQCL